MNEHMKRRIDDFKAKIDYNSKLTKADKLKNVVYRDFNPQKWNFRQGFDVGLALEEKVHIYEYGLLQEIQFINGTDTFYCNLFISNSGPEFAMEQLLNDALSTTMMVIPYEKCPYNLGDINISSIINDTHHIKWTYLNVYFDVSYIGNKLNIKQFCSELQRYTEGFVVSDSDRYRPRFDEFVVSSSSIKPGEEVTIYIVPEHGEAFNGGKKGGSSSLRLEKFWAGDVLSLEKEREFFFRFKGIAEGTETIAFILADINALVCSKQEVTITVRGR